MKAILSLFAVVLFCSISYADTTTYFCNYPKYAAPEGLHKQKGTFELRFLVNNPPEKSYLVGNNGSAEVAVISNWDGGITLVEITNSGNVMTTAISKDGESTHSRSNSIVGKLVPSQHYGKCVLK